MMKRSKSVKERLERFRREAIGQVLQRLERYEKEFIGQVLQRKGTGSYCCLTAACFFKMSVVPVVIHLLPLLPAHSWMLLLCEIFTGL